VPGFRRDLGYWQLTAIAFGGVIGSGWLPGALVAANTAGPASLITWLVGGVALLLISYLGATAFGGRNSIPGPWDSVVVGVVGTVAYVAGVTSSVSHLGEHPSAEYEPELAITSSGSEGSD